MPRTQTPGKGTKVEAPIEVTRALAEVTRAITANDLRRALAVILPSQHGLSLQATADVLGRSLSWVANARSSQMNSPEGTVATTHGGRRNELLRPEDESAFMEHVCLVYIKLQKNWRTGVTHGPEAHAAVQVRFERHVHLELERRVGRPVSKSTVYNLMARVGKQRFPLYKPWHWRKFCDSHY